MLPPPKLLGHSFGRANAFTDIIQFFDLENIQDSTSPTVMPILNTMRPLMAQFYKKHSHWSLEVAAYLAAVFDSFSELYWDYPDELEGNLLDAKIPFPDDSFVLPRFAIKSKAPLSLSRIHDDSDDAGDGDRRQCRVLAPPRVVRFLWRVHLKRSGQTYACQG
ncbi:hypothetical protein C8F04DRAFT_1278406 [Mycena alexandri]|uniref:Uncharacterized protein n=1 Tax=Mycena alexandri TaxID=1745969 RepID=A0AAD6RZJ5_9AGAR|nr:hypothetical protein C8F04DRAFT_1278406 [Mycena alexandri]